MIAKQPTKDKIIHTATRLFLEKGYDRTSVRDIATKAKINVSLMNYYFRSKEMLFETIIDLLIGKASISLKEILNAPLDLEQKIEKYISRYIDILIENPLLISFILAVLSHNPEKLTRLKVADHLYNTEVFSNQLMEEARKGTIREVNPEQLYVNILSLIAFPFAIKDMINYRNNYTNQDFVQFIQHRKRIIYEMIISYLKPNQN
ncbi:MAG: TetR family transcriptional regulator [Bacteroidales bacterium]|jgi:AcrR family transcriptional regulator|nr:TetR family transcriptional regulator [Bacteroidales bacterium]